MIIGHLATTLVAKRQSPTMPWWMLISAAFLNDIVMFTLVLLGIERMEPDLNAAGPTMSSAVIEMTYSHDLLPQLFWISLSGILVFLLTRDRTFAVVAMLLTFVHWVSDLISGYGHFVYGPDSHAIGTDWYHQNFLAALIFEGLLGVFCVYWFTRNRAVSRRNQAALYIFFGLFSFLLLLF